MAGAATDPNPILNPNCVPVRYVNYKCISIMALDFTPLGTLKLHSSQTIGII